MHGRRPAYIDPEVEKVTGQGHAGSHQMLCWQGCAGRYDCLDFYGGGGGVGGRRDECWRYAGVVNWSTVHDVPWSTAAARPSDRSTHLPLPVYDADTSYDVVPCTSWVYDKSQYTSTIVSRASSHTHTPDIIRNMSYIHSSPNLKTLAITFVNDSTTWYCPQMSMLLSNKNFVYRMLFRDIY